MCKPDILVLLQPLGGGLHPSSIAAINAALELGEGRNVCGLLLADKANAEALAVLNNSGLHTAYICEHPAFALFRAEEHCAALLHCIRLLQPESLLVGATPEGRTLAPMLAAKMRTGVTADCTALAYTDDGLLLQTRPAFGGDIMADILTPTARPQIATLRYSVSNPALPVGDTKVEYIAADFSAIATPLPRAEWVERIAADADAADVIIALGGGFSSREQTDAFAEYAQAQGAGLMCSRALVERGWFGRSSQIGLSGQSVSPRLLICFGISGSVQFMAGAGGSICAVNLDETAPIMRQADLPIVGDMHEIIALLNEGV